MTGWAHPLLAWLLPALLGLALLRWVWAQRARRRHLRTGAGVPGLTTFSPGLSGLRQGLLWIGLAFALVSLIGPRWGTDEEIRQARGADLLVAIDCSRSMLADDLFPDRSRAARDKARDLLTEIPDLRVALLPFAGIATLRCPLTGDHLAVERMLEDCTPALFPVQAGLQGTAIGRAVSTGIQMLGRDPGRGQAVLIISDGADPDAAAVDAAAAAAAEAGIPIYGIFVGDPSATVTVDIEGRKVAMQAERATLDRLATRTGGISVATTLDAGDVKAVATHLLDHLAQSPWEERRRMVLSERYRWPLLPAMILLTLGWLMPTSARRREVSA